MLWRGGNPQCHSLGYGTPSMSTATRVAAAEPDQWGSVGSAVEAGCCGESLGFDGIY